MEFLLSLHLHVCTVFTYFSIILSSTTATSNSAFRVYYEIHHKLVFQQNDSKISYFERKLWYLANRATADQQI